ncbi:hypothetical protein [Clostridium estertheticum]
MDDYIYFYDYERIQLKIKLTPFSYGVSLCKFSLQNS